MATRSPGHRLVILALITVVSATAMACHGPDSAGSLADDEPTLIATVRLGSGADSPQSVAVNPSSNLVYVANNAANGSVSVIDGERNTAVGAVPVGSWPVDVAVNPATNLVYVANPTYVGQGVYPGNPATNNVSVIDGDSNTLVATISVDSHPTGVAVNPATNLVYVANPAYTGQDLYVGNLTTSKASVIDGGSNTVVGTVSLVASQPQSVAVNPSTNRIYVANYGTDSVSVIDGDTNTVVATVPVVSGPWAVAVNPSTNRIYVANYGTDSVSVIDGATNAVAATIPVGSQPEGVAVNPTTDRIYVANLGDDSVSVIDGSTNAVVATVPVGSYPRGVAVNPATNRIYVGNYGDDTVSVIEDTGGAPPPTPTQRPTD